MHVAALTLTLVLAEATPAPAAAPTDPAATALAEGITLYHAFEFEQAIFSFERAAVDPDRSRAERALALVWLGMAQGAIGDTPSAQRNFEAAARLDGSCALPEAVSPKIAEVFNSAKESAAKTSAVPKKPNAPFAASTLPVMLYVGAGAVGIGAAGGVTAGGLFLAARARADEAANQATFQDDAKRALDAANALATAAIVVGAISGAAGVTGAVLLAVGVLDE